MTTSAPSSANILLLGTWNHRGVLKEAFDLHKLCEDINSKRIGICAIQETEFETHDEQFKEVWINKCLLLFYTRGKKRQKDGSNSKGLGFYLSPEWASSLCSHYLSHASGRRILVAKFQLINEDTMTIINVHAPTGSSDEKDTEHFYMVLTHIYRQEEDYVDVSWMR